MILISAGHHPGKRGAHFEDFYEHDEAVLWATLIVHNLGSEGMLVPADVLRKKVNFINAMRPSIAMEIHFNSAVDEDGKHVGRGCETLYYPGSVEGKKIADRVQATLANIFPPDRGVKEGWYRMNKDFGPDYFLARTSCASIIIEPEFVHRKDIIETNRIEACAKLAETLRGYSE